MQRLFTPGMFQVYLNSGIVHLDGLYKINDFGHPHFNGNRPPCVQDFYLSMITVLEDRVDVLNGYLHFS